VSTFGPLCFDGARRLGVATSISLHIGGVFHWANSRFLAIAQPSGSVSQRRLEDLPPAA
jgi:hypothetical protein